MNLSLLSVSENLVDQTLQYFHFLEKAPIRSNIVASGLASTSIKPAINELVNLSNSVLKTPINITEAQSLPKNNGYVFTLNSNLEANNMLMSKAKLRGTNVFIQREATADERVPMFHLRQLGKAIHAADPRLKVRNGISCIYINDVFYSWPNGYFTASSDALTSRTRKF